MMFEDWVKQTGTHQSDCSPSDGARSVEEGDGQVVIFNLQGVQSSEDTATTAAVMGSPKNKWRHRKLFKSHQQRRRVLLVSLAVLVLVVVIAVAVPEAISSSSKSPSSSSSSASNGSDQDDAFDFTSISPEATTIPAANVTAAPSVIGISSPTGRPSSVPSGIPSFVPSNSLAPTGIPTSGPSITSPPTTSPSIMPTMAPTAPVAPISAPPILPLLTASETLLTFCVIADVPYDQEQAEGLPGQIATQMEGCEFLVHLGDLFIGDTNCDEKDYHTIRDIMMASKVPTFVVIGDNEWNDCVRSRIDAGWELWNNEFLRFENNWNHTYNVVRQVGFEENFYFIAKRTLVIGLNLVGGRVHNQTEWIYRQQAEYEWTRNIINLFVPEFAAGVILLAHAKPSADQRFFFSPLKDDVENTWKNAFPILYLHGDGHSFVYAPYFRNQPNLLRMQHEGGVRDPILKINADPAQLGPDVHSAFQYDRQLQLVQ